MVGLWRALQGTERNRTPVGTSRHREPVSIRQRTLGSGTGRDWVLMATSVQWGKAAGIGHHQAPVRFGHHLAPSGNTKQRAAGTTGHLVPLGTTGHHQVAAIPTKQQALGSRHHWALFIPTGHNWVPLGTTRRQQAVSITRH